MQEYDMFDDTEGDYYVYFLIDKHTKIRYVGHGRGDRVRRTDVRTRGKEFVRVLDEGGYLAEYSTHLTKQAAMVLEKNLIVEFFRIGLNLLNKNVGSYGVMYDKDFLKYKVRYDETSPTFLSWVNSQRSYLVGKPAGSIDRQSGYGQVRIDGKLYYIHRIIACLELDSELTVESVVNHIDGNRSNNVVSNLEIVSHKVNAIKNLNRKPGRSGVVGVTLYDGYVSATVVKKDGSKSTRKRKVKGSLDAALKDMLSWKQNQTMLEYPEIFDKEQND